MSELIINVIFSIILVVTTSMIYYEILRYCWLIIPKIPLAPRKRILIVMIAIFFGHTVAVWVYGAFYYFLCEYLKMGELMHTVPGSEDNFISYVYYSAVTYSSLGIGDIIPQGTMRFLTGVEVLNGLVLIGWSVSFTYLAMERFWGLHREKK